MHHFGTQELANTSWAYATLQVKDEPLLAALSSASIRKISVFDPRNLSNTAWAYATLLLVDDPLFESISASAIPSISSLDCQGLSNLAWACATLGFEHAPLMPAISSASIAKIRAFSTQNLSNTAWAFAVLGLLDAPLMAAISSAVLALIRGLSSARRADDPPDDFAMGITGVIWAFNFAGVLDSWLYREVLGTILEIGRNMDSACPPAIGSGDGRVPTGFAMAGVPHVALDLPDRLVMHKPPGWEVDTVDVGGARHLSRHLQSILSWPLARDVTHSYGFLHRLDTPSSGLILVAKTYDAYYDLKLQLNVGDLVRDYVVLCHGLVPPDRGQIYEKVHHSRHEGNLPSVVCRTGKPSLTRLKVIAHCSRGSEDFSLVVIRIQTGRRHQIRAHTTHIGHPTVCDGKYTSAETFSEDRAWCERNFLHRYRLAFTGRDGRMHEVVAPLPGDLVDALGCVAGRSRQSSLALAAWLAGEAPRDWSQYGVLSDATR